MRRLPRLLAILTLLQGKKYTTAEQIAEHFGISIRTVYRDIQALTASQLSDNEAGSRQIAYEPGKGYYLVQGYFLPPVQFSMEEANALLLMERVVSGFADKGIERHYATALQKVKAVLRNSQKEQLELLNDHIVFHVPECLKYNQEYLAMLQTAIGKRLALELTYQTKQGETTRRQVEPIGLVFYALGWHLMAWCHLRKDYRDFKVARIVQMRCLDVPFKKADHLTLEEYMATEGPWTFEDGAWTAMSNVNF